MRKESYVVLYSGLYLLALVFFPVWLSVPSFEGRAAVFFSTLLLWLASLKLISSQYPSRTKEHSSPRVSFKHKAAFALIFIVAFVVLFPLIKAPIRTRGDEPIHVHLGAAVIDHTIISLERSTGLPILAASRVAAWLLTITLIAFLSSTRRRQKLARFLFVRWRILIPAIAGASIIWFFAAIKLTSGIDYKTLQSVVLAYEPLGTMFVAHLILLFGYSEFWMRFPYSMLHLLSALVAYKTVALYRPKKTAFKAGLLYFLFPIALIYFARAKPIAAEAFLFFLAMHYLFRHEKHGSKADLWTAILISAMGTLFKMGVMISFISIGFYLFTKELSELLKKPSAYPLKKKAKYYIPPLLTGLIPILIIYALHNILYPVSVWPTNGTYTIYHLTSYAKLLPLQITWTASALFLLGFLFSIWKRRDPYFWLLTSWFVSVYITYSSHKFIVSPRWTVVYLPVAAAFISEFLSEAPSLFKSSFLRKSASFTSLALFWWLIISLSITAYHYSYVPNYKYQFLPYEKAANFVAKKIKPEEGIYRLLPPYYFYERKAGMTNFVYAGIYAPPEKQSAKSLHDFCLKHNIKYIIFAKGHSSPDVSANVPIGNFSPWYYQTHYLTLARPRKYGFTNRIFSDVFIGQLENSPELFSKEAEFRVGGTNSSVIVLKTLLNQSWKQKK